MENVSEKSSRRDLLGMFLMGIPKRNQLDLTCSKSLLQSLSCLLIPQNEPLIKKKKLQKPSL
jgi:hypothetical protein